MTSPYVPGEAMTAAKFYARVESRLDALEQVTVAGGTVTVPVTAANSVMTYPVTYPTGAFPNGVTSIQVTVGAGDPSTVRVTWANSTATGFEIRLVRTTATNTTVSWTAFGA